jgi:cytochrome c oxidase subunit 4
MAHAHDEHASNTGRIWKVFWFLSAVTIVEVILGMVKPGVLYHNSLLGLNLLNWVFIILTLVKAYGIVWAFMHMEAEVSALRRSVVWTVIFLVIYLVFILLVEANYIYGVFRDSTIKWNF